MNNRNTLKKLYAVAKSAKVGSTCKCPSCGTEFIKTSYQQGFCKTKTGTYCKDYYWNNVTPSKRNNTTRISPANDAFMEANNIGEYRDDDFDDDQSWDAHKSY